MPNSPDDTLYAYRCNCGKLLFKGLLADSTIQIKCRKCGELMSFQGQKDHVSADAHFALMLDKRGNVVSASSNIQDLLGYTLSELLAMPYGNLLPVTRDGMIETSLGNFWALPRKERYFYKSRVTLKRKDGKYVTGTMQSKFIAAASQDVLFCIFQEGQSPANSRLAPEFFALREYPFFLRVNPKGICLEASAARNRPHSRSRSEIVGFSYVDFLQEGPAEKERVLALFAAKKPFELIGHTYSRVDGSSIRLDTFFMPNYDQGGLCTDYSVYAFDGEILASHERHFSTNEDAS